MKRTTISIALYGQLPYTRQCLKYLFQNTDYKTFNLYLFNNASKDNTFKWLVSQRDIIYPDDNSVKLVNSPVNVGFGMAHNKVAEKSETEFTLFLNNDIIPLPDWLDSMVEVMDKNPHVAIVGSKLISPFTGGIQHAGVVLQGMFPVHRLFGINPNHPSVNKLIYPIAVTGACFLIRTKQFLENGGFDSHYLNGWEDIDYCFRIKEKGFLTAYQPKSVLYHYEGQSEGRMTMEDNNRVYFMNQWGEKIKGWLKKEREKIDEREKLVPIS